MGLDPVGKWCIVDIGEVQRSWLSTVWMFVLYYKCQYHWPQKMKLFFAPKLLCSRALHQLPDHMKPLRLLLLLQISLKVMVMVSSNIRVSRNDDKRHSLEPKWKFLRHIWKNLLHPWSKMHFVMCQVYVVVLPFTAAFWRHLIDSGYTMVGSAHLAFEKVWLILEGLSSLKSLTVVYGSQHLWRNNWKLFIFRRPVQNEVRQNSAFLTGVSRNMCSLECEGRTRSVFDLYIRWVRVKHVSFGYTLLLWHSRRKWNVGYSTWFWMGALELDFRIHPSSFYVGAGKKHHLNDKERAQGRVLPNSWKYWKSEGKQQHAPPQRQEVSRAD